MKMKKAITTKNFSAAVVAGILLLTSCAKNNDVLNSSDTQNVNSESVSDSYTSETSDMSTSVVSNVTSSQYATGRVEGEIHGLEAKDARLAGATITIVKGPNSTKDNPNGVITIDFGTTGVTTNGVTRKGKILISYSGRKDHGQSTRTLRYSGYSRNGVVFDDLMTFTITNTAAATALDSSHFNHLLTGGKLTFSDNTTILREADYNVTIDYVAKTLTLSADTGLNAKLHSASGTTRAGKEYTMDINTPLVYKAECLATKVYIAVSGEKTITAGLVAYKINYGDGVCDNTVTITVGGKSATITVDGNGN
jgi:hypothetical protein